LCGPQIPQKMPRVLCLIIISLFWRLFLYTAACKSFFSYKLRPAKHFISRMWPADQFGFETPALIPLKVALFGTSSVQIGIGEIDQVVTACSTYKYRLDENGNYTWTWAWTFQSGFLFTMTTLATIGWVKILRKESHWSITLWENLLFTTECFTDLGKLTLTKVVWF
jgi:hypothetical protein